MTNTDPLPRSEGQHSSLSSRCSGSIYWHAPLPFLVFHPHFYSSVLAFEHVETLLAMIFVFFGIEAEPMITVTFVVY